jgi:aryl-alcohol dehydrogenase-like predicted oxidoreductase
MSFTRRSFLKATAGAGAALMLQRVPLLAELAQEPLIFRTIPRSGERVPLIGLGGLGLNLTPESENYERGQEVIRLFHELGGKVVDTAPGYRESEGFLGETIQKFGIQNDLFIATKFNALQILAGNNVRPSGGEEEDKAWMESQMQESLELLGRTHLDLQQVWNLGDIQSNAMRSDTPAGYLQWHMDKATEWRAAGLTRYIGITTSRAPQYAELADAMGTYPIDFIQVDYSIDNLLAAERLLPAAQDNGVGVLINRPFGSGALFRQATERGKTLPPWAGELGITSWAQYFLKFIVSHPAITAAIPATSNPVNLQDNMGAGVGELPDESTRRRMLEYWQA